MGLFLWDSEPSKIFVGDTPISKVFLWDVQVRPSSQPITQIWIYWSESLWVISFQTSAWNGISIADKNLWATQVYNSWDNLSLANMGRWYQRWNNYWWDYWVDPVNLEIIIAVLHLFQDNQQKIIGIFLIMQIFGDEQPILT